MIFLLFVAVLKCLLLKSETCLAVVGVEMFEAHINMPYYRGL